MLRNGRKGVKVIYYRGGGGGSRKRPIWRYATDELPLSFILVVLKVS